MKQFKVHLYQDRSTLSISSEANCLEELGEEMLRNRCLIAELIEEAGNAIEPSVRVLIPGHRIHLISEL